MSEKEAAEKRIRQIMDEMDKNAMLDDQIFELKAWKTSLGYNFGEKTDSNVARNLLEADVSLQR